MRKNKSKKDEKLEQWLRYEGMRDKALSMAYTLRKIDQELHLAAACEGDYPGGYKSENLLPNLCKIMYASEGYHQEDEMLTDAERKRRNKCNQ
jgi:hypothetical protein